MASRGAAAPASARTPISSSIQCASAGGTRCTVPRIGQVRIASRRSSAALTSARVNAGQPGAERPQPAGHVLRLHRAEPARPPRRPSSRRPPGCGAQQQAGQAQRKGVRVSHRSVRPYGPGYDRNQRPRCARYRAIRVLVDESSSPAGARRGGQQRRQLVGHHLAELDAPLVERVDLPDRALGEA